MEQTLWKYVTSGKRAMIVEEDGTTVCEVVCPGDNNREALARQIVMEHNYFIKGA